MKNYLYDGWLKILRIYHNERPYEKLEMYSAVSALITNQENKILLVKQYRPCIGKYSWEIPAGCLDQDGESKIQALIREIKEETDIDKEQINFITLIRQYYSMCGCSDSQSYIYHVTVDCEAIDKKIEDDDVEEIKWVTIQEFKKMYLKGEIIDNKTQRAYEYFVWEYQSGETKE